LISPIPGSGAGRAHQAAGHLHLAAPVALRAPPGLAAGLRAAPLALRATRRPLDGDLPLGAEDGVAEVDLDRRLDVVAPGRLARTAAGGTLPALREEIAEHGAQIAEVRGVEAAAGETFEPARSEAAAPPASRRRR